MVMIVITLTFFGALYVFWEQFLHFQYPVPMMGYMYLLLSIITILIAIWFRFPLEWVKQESFRKRLLWFSISFFVAQLAYFEYGLITKTLLTLPKNWLWIPGLFLPLIKEFNCWIQTNMYKKSSIPADALGSLPTSHTKKYLPRQQTWAGPQGSTPPPQISPSPTQSEYESCDQWEDY